MSPAEIRALMVDADQRVTTTEQAIAQARAEGMLSSWRAWLPGLLGERPRDEILTAVKDAIATTPQAWTADELGSKMDRREIDDAAENVLLALAPFMPTIAPDPDLGKIGPGHVCKHQVRWPHPCDDCDRAAWEARPSTQAEAEARGLV